jgi:hypothetical protein
MRDFNGKDLFYTFVLNSLLGNIGYVSYNSAYLDLLNSGQQTHFNIFKSGSDILKSFLLYFIVCGSIALLLYKLVILNNESLLWSFIFGAIMSILLACYVLLLYSNVSKFIFTFVLDCLVNGLSALTTTYLFTYHYEIIDKYIFIFVILNIFSLIILSYKIYCYSYNITNYSYFLNHIKNNSILQNIIS